MRASRSRTLGLCTALLAVACSSHHPGDRSTRESCPGAVLGPVLFRRIQGTWRVRHTFYRLGQKPPALRPVGALTIDGCRYTFTADEGAALGRLGRWLPFVDRRAGVVEIVRETSPDPNASFHLDLGVIRLHGDPPTDAADDGTEDAVESVELVVRERLQDGEYLSMITTGDQPSHTFAITRGRLTSRPDHVPVSADPDGPAIDWEARMQEAAAALPRWRREAAARAAAASAAQDDPSAR